VDETYIRVGSKGAWLWVAVDPYSGKFLALELSLMVNSLVAWRFLAKLRHRYGRKPLYTDGATHYPLAARWARLSHTVYGEGDALKAIMERYIQVIKDRTECFDDYFPCMEEDCDHAHIHNWLSLYAAICNHIHIPSEQLSQALVKLEDIETEKFQKLISKALT
jgi:transposase-like protein